MRVPLFFWKWIGMTERSRIKIEILVVLVLTLCAYINSVLAPFLSLDDLGILNNLQNSEQSYLSMFFGGGGDYFRPLTFVSFLIDLKLFGFNAPAFHLVNLAFHSANVLLVYYLSHLLVKTEQPSDSRAPLIASLFFALHPVNSEAVMWVAARTDLICCFFFLMALIISVEVRQMSRSIIALFIVTLLSLLAKESSVGLTGILLVWWLSQKTKEREYRTLWLAFAAFSATAVYLLMRSGMHIKADAGIGKVLESGTAKPLGQMIYDSVAALGFYISKAIFPFPLNFAIVTINKPLSVAIFICALAAFITLYLRFRLIRLPLLIFAICLIPPVLALHGKLPWTPYAERYLYLSMTGFALLVGFAVSKQSYRLYLVAFTTILLMSLPTLQRVNLWGQPMDFWKDVIQKSPEFPRSYVGVAYELLQDKKYVEAEPLLITSLKMGLNKDYVWNNLAMVRLGKGDLYGYECAMLQAAELSGNPTQKYIGLIQTVSRNSDDEAGQRRIIGYYLKAQQREPRFGDGLYNAAKIYLKLGEPENALIYFHKFLKSPGDSMYQPFAEKFIRKLEAQGNRVL